MGKEFIVRGPTSQEIAKVTEKPAKMPLRVYAGLATADSFQERAKIALQELIRVGGFERKVLIVATPTGTGWLDPGGVDTIEYLHGGDTAIVSMQYSYLPSWITILVDPTRSIESSKALFNEVYSHWKSLDSDQRPKLYLHGLSLGSLGIESCADLFTLFSDPIQGGVFSGPPFPSPVWNSIVKGRDKESPMWLPTFRDESMVRFTSQTNHLLSRQNWSRLRFVYLQYASDPMVFFSTDLPYREPTWLQGTRGPDVSPYVRWWPIVTFFQILFDLPMATSVPTGYGHNYAPADYLECWISVTTDSTQASDEYSKIRDHFKKK
jgi:uncharacterized membrane protein